MYVITGITGQVGGAVARTLLAEGANVRAVARDARKAAPWVERGCELAIAEMSDAPALARAFAGADGVFVLIPPIFDPSPGFVEAAAVISAVRDALAEVRPARTVCLSTVGAQVTLPNLLSQLAMMERELGTLDLPIAFVRAAWFMENAAWDVATARDGVIQTSCNRSTTRSPWSQRPISAPQRRGCCGSGGRAAASSSCKARRRYRQTSWPRCSAGCSAIR